MITTISAFSRINEIRLPNGYFAVQDTFMLPLKAEGEVDSASSVFNKGSIIEINVSEKYIKKWSKTIADTASRSEWKFTQYPWVDLTNSAVYPEFKKNVMKLEPEEVPDFYKTGKDLAKTFTTSYKYLNKKLGEYQLSPDTKIKIVIL